MKTSGKGWAKFKQFIPLYLMMVPGAAYLIINNYIPMAGIVIAFKKYNVNDGIFGSPWSGLENFEFLFGTRDAFIIIRNTLLYNIAFILVNMVVAIMLAIFITDVVSKRMRKIYQSSILFPYLISIVVVSYGISAQVEVTTACFQPLPRWHVLGDKGTLNLLNWECDGSVIQGKVEEVDWTVDTGKNAAGSTRTMRPRPEESVKVLPLPDVNVSWADYYRNYKDVLEGKGELYIQPDTVLRAVKVIDAIRESHASGKSISCEI